MSIKRRHYFYQRPLTLLDILNEKSLNVLRWFGHIYTDPFGNVHIRIFKNNAHNNSNN